MVSMLRGNPVCDVTGHAYAELGKSLSLIWVLGSTLDVYQKIAGSCFNLKDFRMPIKPLACSSFQKYYVKCGS